MDNSPTPLGKPSNNHLVPVAITVVAFILIILVGIYTILTYGRSQTETPQEITTNQAEKSYSPPRLEVDSWKIDASAAPRKSASTAAVYVLNPKYTKTDFNGLLFNFFTPTTSRETTKSFQAYSEASGSSMLYMQKESGSFLYKSDVGIPLSSTSGQADENRRIVAFAQNALRDDTLASFATYEKKSRPGVIYYELHRDWNRLGFPLFNLFGLLNLSNTDLRTLTLAQPFSQSTPDDNIIKTSDNTDGLKRPSDFNTVTIGVKDGRVVDVISNLRLLSTSGNTRTVANKLISYDTAVEKLKKNEYTRLYTSPAGEGVVDREKMYPQNKARLKEAVVTESTIAYLEELPGTKQSLLTPYYVFRGTAELSTGYRVSFVATVPAIADSVLGAYTAQVNSTQQQGTFEFQDPPLPTPTDAPVAQITQRPLVTLPPTSEICRESPRGVSELYNTQIDDTTGMLFGQYDMKNENGDLPDRAGWYGPQWFVILKSHDIELVDKIIDTAMSKLGLQSNDSGALGNNRVRAYDGIINELESTPVTCPVRISGRSPSLFVYTEKPMNIQIDLPDTLTYADPRATGTVWNIQTPREYLYYEYAPVEFTKPAHGWTVQKSRLREFSDTIATRLALTQKESERLFFELTHAAHDIAAANLHIGLINAEEIGRHLPLTIVPPPTTIHRIHFHVSPASNNTGAPPVLRPLSRSGYTVIELGATAP